MPASINCNSFTWHELLAIDTDKAVRFYGAVVGYGTMPWPDPTMKYTVLTMGGTGVAGLMALPQAARDMGAPAHWMGTIEVDDVAATIAKAKDLGATIHMGPVDLPRFGTYAVLADPAGAVFSVMASLSPATERPDTTQPGRVSWNELWSTDPETAWNFYQALFGWTERGTMDMGPAGTYRLYGRPGDANSLGGMAKAMPQMPASAWLYYLTVPDIDHAATRIRESGGTVVHGPEDIRGGGRTLQACDDQGAMFAVYSHAAG